ncbi:hypothetical protein BP6252_07400 [Coleophoma cylindrospora]|uniref:BZIP domain-containing protein n=1 Tax=Coleophoma cylindrospora TaxID=1849047 RepID=A0A3D8RHH0_9HELO|nr:hypothetical protein BP6252_07400 [Coleophoma cylindrospora]
MSQPPSASRPASRSSADGQRVTLPPVKLRDDLQQTGQPIDWRSEQRQDLRSGHHTLPSPQARAPAQAVPTSRDLGVLSILNPAEPDSAGSGSSGRRPSAGSPQSSIHSSFGQGSQVGASPSSTGPSQGYSGNSQDTLPRGRRILTPRSPRTVSAGMGTITGTRDAQRSPFIGSRSRAFAAESGPTASSESAAMHTQQHQQQNQHYGFPPASTPLERRQSGAYSGSTQPPHSQSVSPSMSTSSHIPSTQTSPATYHPSSGLPPPSQNYFPGSSLQQAGGMAFGGGPEGLYHVPVDVHQASRLADEKRARNAGASARFRQRRKEKEREASSNIERLQQAQRDLERRVREVEQERDFYRNERDRFRDVVFRTPGLRDTALQGPPSPRAIRTGSSSFPPPPPPGPPSGAPAAQPPPPNYEGGPERASRRQRTNAQGDFAPAPFHLPPATTLPPVQGAGFIGQPILPPLRIDNPTAISSAPNLPPTTSVAPQPPYDPYARPPFDRRWSGDTSGRR